MAILPDLSALSREQLAEMVKALAASQSTGQRLTIKLGTKGNVCVYGLGRYPTSLYASQWERLLDPEFADRMKAFMAANRTALATKD